MKLYHALPSPFVRKVMVVLKLTGQEGEVEILDGFGTPVAPNEGVCGANPIGKIPCLILEDGTALFDSRVVCRYLDKRAAAGLYPTGDTEFSVLTTEALADGMMDAAVLGVYEGRVRPPELQYAPWVQSQLSKVHRALGDLEGRSASFGAEVEIGQIAVACALGYLDFRYPDLGWREGRPRLAEWFDGFSA
ncbi:MAG: glutathione S-transferase C-terminal domain-containing protein, partial [Pseudomonadota bacterium]